MNLRAVLEQNSRSIDEILKKAVPDISPAVIEEMKKSGEETRSSQGAPSK
jgi:hypothetical protein